MSQSPTLLWRLLWYALGVTSVIVLVVIAGWALTLWPAYHYPYGWSHCCDKQLGIALFTYSEEQAGKYPTGGTTPEASLSLLYPKYVNANVLRGKIVPLDVVERQLESGQQLTPDTCGWYYVDGLARTPECSSTVAILWDKVGLDHNGGRLPYGGNSVLFMDGGSHVIREADWNRFLIEQRKAWEVLRQRGTLTTAPWLPEYW